MARPLRIEFEGAVYHVTSRGNARQDIFLDDKDREQFLKDLARVVDRFGWKCHAYCLMSNHYHLLVETAEANLSRGMQLLNGVLSQRFNRRHKRVGHVLQGRFKGILVEKESYLLELARYIVLNPVRAGAVAHPREYRWSSYSATLGRIEPPGLLCTSWILKQFNGDPRRARAAYRRFVEEGFDVRVWDAVKGGILLGSDAFVERMGPLLRAGSPDTEIASRQRFADRPSLEALFEMVGTDRELRNRQIHSAVTRHGYSLSEVHRYVGLHPSTISRIVKGLSAEVDAKDKV